MALSKKASRAASRLGAARFVNKELASMQKEEQDAFLRAMQERKMLLEEQTADDTKSYREKTLAEQIRSRQATEEANELAKKTAAKQFEMSYGLQKQSAKNLKEYREDTIENQRENQANIREDREINRQSHQFTNFLNVNKGKTFTSEEITKQSKLFNKIPYAASMLNAHNEATNNKLTKDNVDASYKLLNESLKSGKFTDSSHVPDLHIKTLIKQGRLPVPTGVSKDFNKDKISDSDFKIIRSDLDRKIMKAHTNYKSRNLTGNFKEVNLGDGILSFNARTGKSISEDTKSKGREVYKNRFPYLDELTKVDNMFGKDVPDSVIKMNAKQISRYVEDLIRKADGLVNEGTGTTGVKETYYINKSLLDQTIPNILKHIEKGNLPKTLLENILVSEKAGERVENTVDFDPNNRVDDQFIADPINKHVGNDLYGGPITPDIAMLTFSLDKQTHLTPETRKKMEILRPLFKDFILNKSMDSATKVFEAYKKIDPTKSTDEVADILIKSLKQSTKQKSFDSSRSNVRGNIVVRNGNLEYFSATDSSSLKKELQGQLTQNNDIRNLIRETRDFIKEFPLSAGAGATVAMGIEDVKSVILGVSAASKDWLNKSFDEMLNPESEIRIGVNGRAIKENLNNSQKQLVSAAEQKGREEYASINEETEFLTEQNGWTEGQALRYKEIRKVIVLKKMALTYRLSGLFQGDSSGRTISNQDYDVAMGALWGEPYAIEAKMNDLEHYFSLKYKSMETLSNNVDSGVYNQVMAIRRAANNQLSKEYTQKVLKGDNFKSDINNQSAQAPTTQISKVIPFYRNVKRFYKTQEDIDTGQANDTKMISYNYTKGAINTLSSFLTNNSMQAGIMKISSTPTAWPLELKNEIAEVSARLAGTSYGNQDYSRSPMQTFVKGKTLVERKSIQKAFYVYIANEIRKKSQEMLDAQTLELR